MKTMWVYQVITSSYQYMDVHALYVYVFMCADYCPFYLHGTLKGKVLHEDSNSLKNLSKCAFIITATRDSKAFATF